MHFCAPGYLVALDHALPSDPKIAYTGTPPIIGCNQIKCESCGAMVRHVDSRSTTSQYAPALTAVYNSADPASSPIFNDGSLHQNSRTYFCLCYWKAVNLGGVLPLGMVDHEWFCIGHPDD